MALDFLKKKKKEEELVGASIKMQTALKMRQQDRAKKEGDEDFAGQHYSQTVPFTVGFVISVIIALIAMEGGPLNFSGIAFTGIRSIDNFVFGSEVFSFFNQADVDKVLTLFLRGISYSFIAAIIPAMAMGIVGMGNRGQVSPFTACWCAVLSIPIIYVLFSSVLAPMLGDLFRGF